MTHLVYGQRQDEGHRATSRHGDLIEGIVRLHPIEDWTAERVLTYLATNMTLPDHFSLHHSSLDCYDCTAFEQDSQDRLQWTAQHYPQLFEAYRLRRTDLDTALQEALCPV